MVCRHSPGDPYCSSTSNYQRRQYYQTNLESVGGSITPDNSNYEIIQVEEISKHLILMVKYPNCKSCAYEGKKVLVYENCKTLDALKWKEIDPHFADVKVKRLAKQAPPPVARFHGNDVGWKHAISFAKGCLET